MNTERAWLLNNRTSQLAEQSLSLGLTFAQRDAGSESPAQELALGGEEEKGTRLAFPLQRDAASRLILQEIANTRTRARLVASAIRILGSEADAEDCVQDALLQAARCAEQFEGRSSPFSWLYRVVLNACRMLRRSKNRDRRGGGAVHVSFEDLLVAPLSPDSLDPESAFVGHELLKVIVDELEQVPEGDANLFRSHVLEDASLADLADKSKLTRQAVKSRLFRVRRRLSERLSRETGETLDESAQSLEWPVLSSP